MALEDLARERVRKLRELLEKGIDPYKVKRFDKIPAEEAKKREGSKVRVAGRIMGIRKHGGIAFLLLQDESGSIQVVLQRDRTPDFWLLDYLDRGDIIGVEGEVGRTRRGEISVFASSLVIMAKALRPIPDERVGVKEPERRYRERYVDLIVNEESRKRFLTISRLLPVMRGFFVERGFKEVLTPILQPLYGGALARPFKTFHHFLEEDMFLRIAPELYLKRLLVGMFEKVFEFSAVFRNEDIDATHNPEFYQIEAYWAYANVNDMMELAERFFERVSGEVKEDRVITWQGKEIDFNPPYERMRMVDAIAEYGGPDIESMEEQEVVEFARKLGYEVERYGEAVEELFDHYVAGNLVNPTFVTDYPYDISPLAKRGEDPRYVERFELFIAGKEIANAYSELNNPIEQYKRFLEEEELRKSIKKEGLEYQPMDRDYVRALEYGMPPAGGIGIGITRLFMYLTDAPSIKDVILFPTLSKKEDIKLVVEMFPEVQEWYK